jgi:hypothetical protein
MRLTSLVLVLSLIFSCTLPSLCAPVPSLSNGWLTPRGMLEVSERQERLLNNAWVITKDITKWPRYLSDLSDRTGLSEYNVKTWFKNVRVCVCDSPCG